MNNFLSPFTNSSEKLVRSTASYIPWLPSVIKDVVWSAIHLIVALVVSPKMVDSIQNFILSKWIMEYSESEKNGTVSSRVYLLRREPYNICNIKNI